ncbi:MAG: EAL domain-containing protein, partial [Thiotrichaceae bacterium]|nr:EAL domain-containing protein [Thiotrichaceae bacterium]
RYDLIGKIDDWVVKKTFSLLHEHPEFVNRIHFISINLSGPSLTDIALMETIMSLFRKYNIDPGKICFEVTETVAISNLNAAISFMTMLKEIGCHFALDDFGSGLSSFAYLKNLPVDFLKIDGVFVKDITHDPVDYVMVKSINNIGQAMGMKTIAEFVETDEIMDILKIMGINYAQGYGVGKPQSFEQLLLKNME